jgi:hypothetical protein
VHDAVLITAPLNRLEAEILSMQDALREASSTVLGGFELSTDIAVFQYPDRYMDDRGKIMWAKVMELLDGAAANLTTPALFDRQHPFTA